MNIQTNLLIAAAVAGAALFASSAEANATEVPEAFVGTFMPHGLDGRDYVDEHIEDLREAMQACYETQLVQSPNLDGLMMLRVHPARNGGAPEVDLLTNRTGSGALASCVEASLERVSMAPTYVSDASITLPVTFRMRDATTTVAAR
ncbi:MAG: hypothetical protein ACJAYU_003970 [Bradymonadia bacterium]|jgi:hypothetical protein